MKDQSGPRDELHHFHGGPYHCDGKLNLLAARIAGWRAAKGFDTSWCNVPEKLMLIVTELGEAMEAFRKIPPWILSVLADPERQTIQEVIDSLDPEYKELAPYLKNFEEELADTAIRLLDLTSSLDIDLEKAIKEKMVYNCTRPPRHGKER